MEGDHEVSPQHWVENSASSHCGTERPLSSLIDAFCQVKLVKCDSKHFEFPQDVKQFNVSERLNELVRYHQTHPLGYDYMNDSDTSSSSEALAESKKILNSSKHLRVSGNLKVKVKNNMIVSSDSDETDDNLESTSCFESPSEVTSESELLENRRSSLSSTELEISCGGIGERCKIVPRQRTRSKMTRKRPKVSSDDDTDSSVSSHSEIIFPSIDVIKRIESTTPPAKERERDLSSTALKNSERKTAGRTLLTEPKPITRRPGKLRGREEWFEERCTGARSDPSPVADRITQNAISKISQNDNCLTKNCGKESKNRERGQKSKTAKLLCHQKMETADDQSIQAGLEKTSSSKNRPIPVRDRIALNAVSKVSENDTSLTKKCGKGSIDLKKSKAAKLFCHQKTGTANDQSIQTGLEKTTSSKIRKNAVVRKRPLSFESRMEFLMTKESDASKATEYKKNNSQSSTRKCETTTETRISKTQISGNKAQAGSNRVEGNGNSVAFESTKQTLNEASNVNNPHASSVFGPGNSLMDAEPCLLKPVIGNYASGESSKLVSNKPVKKKRAVSTPPSASCSVTGDLNYVNAIGSSKLELSKSLIRDNFAVSSVSTLVNSETQSVTGQVKSNSVESLKQLSNRTSNVNNFVASTAFPLGRSVTQAEVKQVRDLSVSITVESGKRINCSLNKGATATPVSSKTESSCSQKDLKCKNLDSEKTPSDSRRKKVAVVSPMELHRAEKSRPTTDKRPLYKLLIEKIVQWNPKWLEEQTVNENPPPEVIGGAKPLPLTFKSYDDYVSFFHPMVVLDVWQSLFQKYLEIFQNKNGKWNNFFYKVVRTEGYRHDPVLEVHCQALVNKVVSYPPAKGDIVLLNTTDSKPNVENCIFGYIHRLSISNFKCSERTIERWNSVVPRKWFSVSKLYRFSVYVKKGRKLPDYISVNIGHGIQNIKDKIMLASSLEYFRDSPLQESIVCPSLDTFFVPDPKTSISGTEQVVNETVVKIGLDSPVKFVLLHGPPGTGKTETVVRLIEELSSNPSSKVLVCTSCDPALDEIAHRLVRAKNSLVRFVRVGTWPGIYMSLFGETLHRKTYDLICEERKKLEKRISDTQNAINEVLFSDGGTSYRNQVDNSALKVLMAKYKRLTEHGSARSKFTKKMLERQVIEESNVVLTTPANVLPVLRGVSFTCCIVDAATQCSELDLLQCLMPCISKLVLLGDCGQLPPQVNSKFALLNGYGRSLFERFCLFFKEHHKVVPFLTLKKQYRMRPELCRFPFTYFYNEALVTVPSRRSSVLRPFILYDVMTDGAICYNDLRPAQVIAHMCRCILELDPNLSIGVIGNTPHELVEYQKVLADRNLQNAEVTWLENFQGREKDVMIVPYFRHSPQCDKFWVCGRKLNVAITRARQCLIILGHASYLMHYKHWNDFIEDAKRWNNYCGVGYFRDIPYIFSSSITAKQGAF